MISVKLLNLDPELPPPAVSYPGDAGFDLYARSGALLPANGGRAVIPTGIALELPPHHVGLVCPRSGLALREGVTCLNAPGVVDPGFRGEVGVILVNTDPVSEYLVRRGDRIAQLVILHTAAVVLVATDQLSPSDRGTAGFGGSGT